MNACLELPRALRWTAMVQANQQTEDGYIPVDFDADFVLRGYKVLWRLTAQYLIRISDHRARPLSNLPLRATEFTNGVDGANFNQGVGQFCKVIVPELVIPKGKKIFIEFAETAGGGPFLLKVVFVGINRYTV